MKSLGKAILYVIFLILFLSASGYAVPVTVTFKDVSNLAAPRSAAWAGFYILSVDGDSVLGMCDDYSTHVSFESWKADRYTYKEIESGLGRWGLPLSDYNMIGYLFQKTFDTTNSGLIADINQAIWYVHNTSLSLTKAAASLYKEALLHKNDTGWYGYMDIITPMLDNEGNPVSQEFLVRGPGITSIPEPATILLFGTGLFGLAGLRHRRFKS